jgi:dienelactone hydrolase
MKAGKIICAVLAVAVLFLCAGSYASAEESFPPLPEALEAMESNGVVTVSTVTVAAWGTEQNYYYEFKPKSTQQNLGFIIYPGGYVDPRSYAPAAQKIAKAGYLVVIVKMPNDLAISGIPRAQEILAAYPDIEQWAIGGHSLGGVSAAGYVKDYPGKMKGVVLWAAYGADIFTIQDRDVSVVVLFGSNDGLATPAKIEAGKPYLPADTRYVEITGGNHTYFGWYDTAPDALQPGDSPADITREEQQKIIVQETLKLLDGISGRTPCGITVTPGTISRFLSLLTPIRPIVIRGEDNATLPSDPEILWSTDGVKTISAKLKDNTTIIAWVRIRPFKLQANETYDVVVGTCSGTLAVKPF